MTYMSVTEVKKNFEAVIERVKAGEVITVTRYGKPAAQLRPYDPAKDSL